MGSNSPFAWRRRIDYVVGQSTPQPRCPSQPRSSIGLTSRFCRGIGTLGQEGSPKSGHGDHEGQFAHLHTIAKLRTRFHQTSQSPGSRGNEGRGAALGPLRSPVSLSSNDVGVHTLTDARRTWCPLRTKLTDSAIVTFGDDKPRVAAVDLKEMRPKPSGPRHSPSRRTCLRIPHRSCKISGQDCPAGLLECVPNKSA